jgi:phosphoribosylaminoimidazole (AIR) synthetase
MGWGFAIIVDQKDGENVLNILAKTGVQTEQIGKVTSSQQIAIHYKNKKLILA